MIGVQCSISNFWPDLVPLVNLPIDKSLYNKITMKSIENLLVANLFYDTLYCILKHIILDPSHSVALTFD